MFWVLAVISHEKILYRVVLTPCTYISLTDTQMFVGNFKGHSGGVPLHDRWQPFPRHDFGRWSNGRPACSYSLFPGLRIGRNKRFQIEEVIVSILNFASFFPSRWPLLFNVPILQFISADSLHKDVTEEAETAWGIVITAVKTTCTQHSDVLSNQFLPFLADIGEERLATRGESSFRSWRPSLLGNLSGLV